MNVKSIGQHSAYRLLTTAGQLLRNSRSRARLANATIGEPVFPGDFVAGVLRDIINASIEPIAQDSDVPYFSAQATASANSCSSAEVGFTQTFDEIIDRNPANGLRRFGGEIFVDDASRAFLLRKAAGYSSGIALRTINIAGIEFPAGSLLHVGTPEDQQGYNLLDRNRFAIRPARDILEIGFARLTALASPCVQRVVSDLVWDEVTGYDCKSLTTMEPQEMQPLAQLVVDSHSVSHR